MSIPQICDKAPDFTLYTVDGLAVSLGETVQNAERVLLIFLRHLG
jgi:peroxiredoxin